jgi:hypothetical protein
MWKIKAHRLASPENPATNSRLIELLVYRRDLHILCSQLPICGNPPRRIARMVSVPKPRLEFPLDVVLGDRGGEGLLLRLNRLGVLCLYLWWIVGVFLCRCQSRCPDPGFKAIPAGRLGLAL